jgi:hypothetical protein
MIIEMNRIFNGTFTTRISKPMPVENFILNSLPFAPGIFIKTPVIWSKTA